ncbi:MAG: hypothetical protein DMG54_28065 [Acidobacteria bacterium]|nr:MAG: hypothetical protein DMG53_28880 [Acidobacteriota bacterium]PYU39074.1 MAG: hypothetical protein DMG54_28065 [Acidobacteriota bacterium]PYU71230.1 MAG: hypothetical protein DMG52_23050 [Acidobacteriota bacterium]
MYAIKEAIGHYVGSLPLPFGLLIRARPIGKACGFQSETRGSRPAECHREPLAEPDMNLSAHPAPIN